MKLRKKICSSILNLAGWKVQNVVPPEIKKYVVCMAPHTSNWDFVIGWLGYGALDVPAKFLIKKEAFFFPLGWLVKKLGGIPVNRSSGSRAFMEAGEQFNHYDELILTVTPEGTRSYVTNWKKGFYHIAMHAKVPIALGYLDYQFKIGGMGSYFYPSGNYEEDFKKIIAFYADKHGRHPENFNLGPKS